MEKGSKLIFALKSSSALLMVVCHMVQVMVGQPRSLYFIGIGPDNSSLMFVARKTILGTFIFLFLVYISFKKFTYEGTYCMTSRSGTLTFT